MLRIVLPAIASIAGRRKGRRTVAAANASTVPTANVAAIAAARYWIRGTVADIRAVAASNIRVAVEIVVAINGDVVVAAPTAPPAPAATPEGPHHHADAKGDRYACGVISRWRVVNGWVGINRWAIHNDGIIRGHVYDLRIRLLHHDYGFVLDDFGFYLLLLIRL